MGIELQENVLEEYLQFSEISRNATYFLANIVSMSVTVVSDCMRDEAIIIIIIGRIYKCMQVLHAVHDRTSCLQ